MKVNPDMVVLAREFRGWTQEELGRKLYVSQAKVAKLEGGLQSDVTSEFGGQISEALGFPIEFFQLQEDRLGFGSSAYYYRKKSDITAADRKRIHANVNLLRIHVKRLLSFVDIQATRPLPVMSLDDHNGSPSRVAQAVRALWRLPEGPIGNLTAIVESAGVVVIPCDFQTRAMDATSLRLAEMPPLVFMNDQLPGDRWRYTLAHELGHLLLHQVPSEQMEDEANEFAAELLMPEGDLRPQFVRLGELRLQDLCNLKPYWKVSIASLLVRANDLGFLGESKRRYLWSLMNRWHWRTVEPEPLDREQPRTMRRVLGHFRDRLKYSDEDLATFLLTHLDDLRMLHANWFQDASSAPRLRLVM